MVISLKYNLSMREMGQIKKFLLVVVILFSSTALYLSLVSATGELLPGKAIVTYEWSNETNSSYCYSNLTNITEGSGFYNASISNGTVNIKVDLLNYYRNSTGEFNISDGETEQKNITLTPVETNVTISGHIKDDGVGIENQTITASWNVSGFNPVNYTTTNADGEYFVKVLGGVNVTLASGGENYLRNFTTIFVDESEEEVNLTLNQAPVRDAWVNGTVEDSNGDSIEGATVSTTWMNSFGGLLTFSDQTDSSGKYSIEVPSANDTNGTYITTVSADRTDYFEEDVYLNGTGGMLPGNSTPVEQNFSLNHIPERNAAVQGYIFLGGSTTERPDMKFMNSYVLNAPNTPNATIQFDGTREVSKKSSVGLMNPSGAGGNITGTSISLNTTKNIRYFTEGEDGNVQSLENKYLAEGM
ncbi:MAG: carboxypeptidase-like regulatory domain-containing protein, partial [Candidatus Aenigmatarchaeota archaeon]